MLRWDAAYVVSEGESILLDLNGYSITRGTYTKSALIQVNTGGNLVVRDNSAAKAGRIYSTNALDAPGKTSIGLGIWAVGGTVTIESGTVEGTYALYATQSGTINVAGGTVSGTTLGVYAKQQHSQHFWRRGESYGGELRRRLRSTAQD